MTPRRLIPLALQALAGILSLAASLYGGLVLYVRGDQAHVGFSLVACIPLILILPFFCFSFFQARTSAILQWIAAFTFLGADVLFSVRNCPASHPCPGFFRMVLNSFFTPMTMFVLLIAALQTLAIYTRTSEQISQGLPRST